MKTPDIDPATMTRLLVENEAQELMDRAASGETTSVILLEMGPNGMNYTTLIRDGDSMLEFFGLMDQVKYEMLAASVEG